MVFPEVSDGLEVGHQPPGQPHQLDIALGFAFQASAGLHPIEVSVDIDLEQHRGMVGRSAGRFRLHASNPCLPKSSPSTKTSTTRTGLSSAM